MSRLVEFFEGDDGRLSMMRLTMFMSFFPSTYVLMVNAKSLSISELLAIYLSVFVVGYLGGKTADIFMRPKSGNSNGNSTDSESS